MHLKIRLPKKATAANREDFANYLLLMGRADDMLWVKMNDAKTPQELYKKLKREVYDNSVVFLNEAGTRPASEALVLEYLSSPELVDARLQLIGGENKYNRYQTA